MFVPKKTDRQNALASPDCYVVYGWQRSYFTHKLIAALRFYGAEWRFEPKTQENSEELRLRSGTHQVPVLHTPENWMIGDTTPLLHLLDGRFPERRMFPVGPLGVLTQIIEEYFDEWIARTSVHWRWNYEENHALLSKDLSRGDEELAREIITWGAKVCRATGVTSEVQKREAEAEYHRVMAAAERQLGHTRYLLGDRPTAVDCIVLGGLRAHFLFDPVPDRALRGTYPAVVRWAEDGADRWDGSGALAEFPDSTEFARFVLAEMAETWAPFVQGNRRALAAGERAFVIPMYGEDVSYLARPYIEQSRRMIQQRVDTELSATERVLLDRLGLAACFK